MNIGSPTIGWRDSRGTFVTGEVRRIGEPRGRFGALNDRPVTAVLLAGTLRPSPLREAMDVPVLCLPMGAEGTVLHAWLRSLRSLDAVREARILVNSRDHLVVSTLVASILADESWSGDERRFPVRAIAEQASWRGAGGVLSDATEDLEDDDVVVVCEGHMLAPADLRPLLTALQGPAVGAVGLYGQYEPAGTYAFCRAALSHVPRVGYYDMKEQLLPALGERGMEVWPAPLVGAVRRLRDRHGYLAALSFALGQEPIDGERQRVSPQAGVSASAILDGLCVIEPGATVGDGAIIHDSVVLSGAVVDGGAVLSQSIVGPMARVPARETVIREVLFDPMRYDASRLFSPVMPRPRGEVVPR